MRIAAAALVTFACAGAPSSSRPAPPATPVKLSAEMQSFNFYVGDWSCKVVMFDEAEQPSSELMVDVAVRPDLGGSWVHIDVIIDGKQVTSELKGFDQANKKFRHIYASADGEVGSLVGEAWQGGMLAMVQDWTTGTGKVRMTMTKRDDRHYSHLSERDDGQGFRKEFTKVCDKRG